VESFKDNDLFEGDARGVAAIVIAALGFNHRLVLSGNEVVAEAKWLEVI